ncbi:serine hydrolase [Pseudoalteromonas sp. MMG012]|uniref:serine hydrolase domain-containing protein n=1 Tax=Pseudoalteromonas sp. MMG012 TaxID=2822686 RepID=UPI001B3A4DC7|nr:serine hydrolase domain-containing protein [Pseudoalteromonas sp. MMG012]MBQ4850380.1 beta-lactamase family protein [Pseudoalteromonas sp. MMG012]
MKLSIKPLTLLVASLILTACGSSSHAPKITLEKTSFTAIATTHLTITADITDEDNDLNAIEWQQVQGPGTTEFVDQAVGSNKMTFMLPHEAGEYVYVVSAIDKKNFKRSERITIQVGSLQEHIFEPLSTLFDSTFTQHEGEIINMASLIDFGDGIVWQDAAGLAQQATRQPMTPEHQFRIASVSKTLSAAVTFKLIEKGLFTLDTPIGALLTDTDMPQGFTVGDLHHSGDTKQGETITIRQLLDQSTGIRDFVSYLQDFQAPDTRAFLEALTQQDHNVPQRWHSDLLIQELLERGLTKELETMPGSAYLYGNSNSDLLAWTLEKFTGQTFEALLEEHVFLPLDMQHTYMDYHQAKKGQGPIEHLFMIQTDAPEYQYLNGNHNVVALGVNTSFAWAGGGIVSTLDDLNAFFSALHSDQFILDAALRSELKSYWRKTTTAEEELEGPTEFYGLAMEKVIEKNYQTVGHSGFWGVYASHVTPLDVHMYTWAGQPYSDAAETFQDQAIKLLHSKGINGTTVFQQ